MTNPIRNYRRDLNLTQEALASIAGITKQVVLKAEQGVYPTLPPSLLKALSTVTRRESLFIENEYEQWINEELYNVRLPDQLTINYMLLDWRLFPQWREHVCKLNGVPNSVSAFCGLMKMHPYVIQKYEAGRLKSTPLQLMERIAFIRKVNNNGNSKHD